MEATEPLIEPESTPAPSWWQTVLAPWLLIHRPSKAAATLAAGPRSAVWVTLIVGALLLAGVVLGATLWAETVTSTYVSTTSRGGWDWVVEEKIFADCWHEWAGDSARLGMVKLALRTALLLILSLTALAWIQLPLVHRLGSVLSSHRRAFASGVSGVGLLVILAALCGSSAAFFGNMWDRMSSDDKMSGYWFVEVFPPLAFVLSAWLLLGWLARARRAVRRLAELPPVPRLLSCVRCRHDLPQVPADDLRSHCRQEIRSVEAAGPSPRCEQCGYDLTHRPTDGRCPECGFAVERSLTPWRDRPGWNWQRWRGFGNWLVASFQVIVHPDRFYRKLRVWWPDETARAFARRQYVSLGIFAGGWVAGSETLDVGWDHTDVPYVCMFALGSMLLGWLIHRVVTAGVASWWLARGTLPDFYPAWQVIHYETAFLWVLFLFNGLWTLSFILFDSWMTELWNGLFSTLLASGNVEIMFMLCGNAALLLAWLWRYGRARRAVQWANF